MAPDPESPLPADPHNSTERLARSAGLAGVATLASRILGLGHETVLAALFGAGNDMDAFIVAFRFPNLGRDLFAEGAMSAAFVPTFTRHLTLRGKATAWHLANNVLTALFLVTAATVAIGCLFARPLVTAYAGEFANVPGKLELTITLTRVMLPFLTLVALAAAVMGMLNSLRHYFLPALAPAAFNVASIVCAIALAPLMPMIGQPRIMSIAIAAILGGLGQIAVQWPSLRGEGFRYAPVLDRRDPGLREVLLLMGPGTLGLAATQVNLFVSTQLAVSQGTGAVSWLQYAFRLIYVPIGLFGVSIATAVLPTVARQAAVNDRQAVSRTVARGIALMLMVTVPATVGLLVLATPIVRLLLERGQFLASDTNATAAAVQCYAVGLVGYSSARITAPVFYALGRSRIAVLLSGISIAVNLALSIVLVRVIGFRGLPLATSLAAIVNGGSSVLLLRAQLGRIGGIHLAVSLFKILIASAVMAVVVVAALHEISVLTPGTGLTAQTIRLSTAISAGLAAVAIAARLLRISEFDALLDEVRQRVAAAAAR